MRLYDGWFCVMCALVCAALLPVWVGCGTGNVGGPNDAPSGASDVDTFAPTQVAAGEVFSIDCLFFDDSGAALELPEVFEPRVVVAPRDAATQRPDGLWSATLAGSLEAACSLEADDLLDPTPARLEVVPGPAAIVLTELDRSEIVAGDPAVSAECRVIDEFGNLITGREPSLAVSPSHDEEIRGSTAYFERSDRYVVSCTLPGAAGDGATLTVLPGLPASVEVGVDPVRSFHARASQIEVLAAVRDGFGNRVLDADLLFSANPGEGVTSLGAGQYRLDEDGSYSLGVEVEGATLGGEAVAGATSVVVSGAGPAIACDAERYRAVAPGQPFTFRGAVADANGVAELRVDDVPVPVAGDGTFSAELVASFGTRFVEIVAVDGVGATTSRACPLILAEGYLEDEAIAPGTVSALLGAGAIDDGLRSGAIDSVGDIVQLVIDSDEVEGRVHETLEAAGRILPRSCVLDSFLGCIATIEADYGGEVAIRGPNEVGVTATDAGLHVQVLLRNIELLIDADLLGFVAVNGLTVTLDELDLGLTLATDLVNGVPTMTVVPGSLHATANEVSLDGGWIPEFLLDVVVDLLQSTVRDIIVDRLLFYVPPIFTEVVAELLVSIDIDALSVEIPVPDLNGGPPFVLSPSFEITGIDTDARRMRMAIGTAFSALPAHAHPNPGVPIPPASGLYDADPIAELEVGISMRVVDQALHALWRAGFLLLDGQAVLGTSLPAGYGITIDGTMPPTVRLRPDGRFEIGIGGLRAEVDIPDIFPEPIAANVGAVASTSLEFQGELLSVGAVTVETIYFDTEGFDIDAERRATLEQVVVDLVAVVVDRLVTDALPRLPIPAFPLPDSFARFDVPLGTELGLMEATMTGEGQHMVVESDFGSR